MMMPLFSERCGGSPEARARKTMWVGVVMLTLGCTGLVTLVLLEALRLYPLAEQINAYAYGLLFGISGGMLGSGFATAFGAWQRLRDPEKLRKFEIKAKDERNQAIQGAAAKMTIVTSAIVLYILLLVCAFVYPAAANAISIMICVMFGIYFFYLSFYARRM